MKITVVVPSYNQGGFIRRTIDSILAQGYPDLELLVMDGGSTDDTRQVLESYGERFFWQSAPDAGQTAAINEGWSRSSGDVLVWVNSDDLLRPGALQAVAEAFDAHPEIQWLYGDCDYIDAADRVIERYPSQAYDYHLLVSQVRNFIPQPATFIRRSAYLAAGPLDASLHYVMDLEYWLRLGLLSPALYLPRTLACLRLHQDAKSVAAFGRFSAEIARVMEDYFRLPGVPAELQAARAKILARAYLLAADMNFWSGRLSEARAYALRSWRRQPLRPRKLYLYLLLGRLGLRLAERRGGNPYSRGQQ